MYCSKCGAEIEEGAAFCAVCGTPVEENITLPVPAAVEAAEADDTQEFSEKERKATIRLMAILSYLGATVFLPAFLYKEKKYLRKHANNGMTLFILQAAASTLACIPILGLFTGAPALVFLTVIQIKGIVHAAKGQSFDMPLIGKWFKILK